MIDQDVRQKLEDLKASMEDQMVLAAKLQEQDPTLPFVSALIMAGDQLSAERSWKLLTQGDLDYRRALIFVGSYGRFDFAVRALDAGLITTEDLDPDLPGLWSGADPDDTNPRYLQLWRDARIRLGSPLTDDPEALAALPRVIDIYRGQDEGATFGIAWSTNKLVAEKFARGAATRQRDRGGVVYDARVNKADVLAYITGRREFEIIVDPSTLF